MNIYDVCVFILNTMIQQILIMIFNGKNVTYSILKVFQISINAKHFSKITRPSTIYALCSGLGKCGVSVVRISGPDAKEAILKMTNSSAPSPPRKAVLSKIIDPTSGQVLDKGIILWFPGPHSFTGEDVVEFHIHGGLAVSKAVLSTLGRLQGFSYAERGEFSKRAFHNNKMDLTALEGLADLIEAETEVQRRRAFDQMSGSLSRVCDGWRSQIVRARAHLEAYIDFSEDDNIHTSVLKDVRTILVDLAGEMTAFLSDSRKGERLKSGLRFVILGKPNVGKSSLLNALALAPAAIVSPIAGTTRDIVRVQLDIGGYPVNVSDTAGLRRDANDVVEEEGIARAWAAVENAHFAAIVIEATELSKLLRECSLSSCSSVTDFVKWYFERELKLFKNEDEEVDPAAKDSFAYEWLTNEKYVMFVNKIDLLPVREKLLLERLFRQQRRVCLASLKTLEGFDETVQRVTAVCEELCGSSSQSEAPLLISERHRTHLRNCLDHIKFILNSNGKQPRSCSLTKSVRSWTYHRSLPEDVNQMPKEVNDSDDASSNVIDFDHCEGSLLSRDDTLLLAAQRLHLAADEIGRITGLIHTEEVLDELFSSFCIGK